MDRSRPERRCRADIMAAVPTRHLSRRRCWRLYDCSAAELSINTSTLETTLTGGASTATATRSTTSSTATARQQPALRRWRQRHPRTAATATTCSMAATATTPSTAATTTTPSSAVPATTRSMWATASTPSSTNRRLRQRHHHQLRCDRRHRGDPGPIDLSALGITAANFATRVYRSQRPAANTVITIRETERPRPRSGTIQINGIANRRHRCHRLHPGGGRAGSVRHPDRRANTITGNAAANLINGLGGNDILSGAGGNDVINGGEGADTLNGGDGNDHAERRHRSRQRHLRRQLRWRRILHGQQRHAGFRGGWTEGGGETTSATAGDIQINPANGSRLHFEEGIDGGEIIQRAFNLTGATAASVQFSYVGDATITGTENVTVQAWNHATSTWQTLTGGVLGTASGTFNVALSADQIGPQSAIRFTGKWQTGTPATTSTSTTSSSTPAAISAPTPSTAMPATTRSSGTPMRRLRPMAATSSTAAPKAPLGDTFVINGNATSETYHIYTLAAWDAVAGNDIASFGGRTPRSSSPATARASPT